MSTPKDKELLKASPSRDLPVRGWPPPHPLEMLGQGDLVSPSGLTPSLIDCIRYSCLLILELVPFSFPLLLDD